MILLPIGHEESTVRRLPVVTFGIMALCIVAFLFSGQGMLVSEDDVELAEESRRAFEYYWEHPYLALDDAFEVLVYGEADGVEAEFSKFAEEIDGMFGERDTSVSVAQEQAELDRLTDAVLKTRDGHSFFRWGLIPADFSFVGLLTHMFMHGGWLHLIGNLLMLYLAGPFIEDVWGRPLFALFYFLSGCAAATAFIAFNVGSEVPMIGASGAIAGVMGAFLVHYHQTQIKFFYMVGFFIRGTFDAPAWVMLPLWLGEQLGLALLLGAAVSGVAYWAHIGGFAFGLIGALWVRKAGILERYVQPGLGKKISTAVMERPGLDLAMVASGEGRHEDAYALLSTELEHRPGDVDVAELYWESATELHRQAAAVPLVLRSIQAQLRTGETDTVCSMWERLIESDPTLRADAAFLLRLTQLQGRSGNHDQARETLRRALMNAGPSPAPGLALKIARMGRQLDPAVSRAILRSLISRDDVALEEKATAQTLLEQVSAIAVQVETSTASTSSANETEESAQPIPLVFDS
jgi:membrane associated rhomboid family serine protease